MSSYWNTRGVPVLLVSAVSHSTNTPIICYKLRILNRGFELKSNVSLQMNAVL